MSNGCKQGLCLFMIAALFSCTQVSRAQSQSVNIKQAIEIALTNNYALRADSLNIEVDRFKNKELAGSYLPQVNYSGKTNYNLSIPSQMLPGEIIGQPSKDFVPVQFGTKYDASLGIELTQTIYRKDLLIKMSSAKLNSAIAHTRYQLSKEDLVYQVAAAYYALQSKAELIRTTTNDYLNLREILTISKKQFETGTLKRIDYESLQINVANKESELNQLLTQHAEQLDYFKYFLGIPASANVFIRDSISSLPASVNANENQLWSRADIHLSNQLIESKEIELKAIRAEKTPAVNGYFRYNYQSQFNETGKAFNNDYWFRSSSMGVSVTIPLFDGNRRRNRISVAQTQIQQLKWQSEQQQQLAQTELTTAIQTLDYNRQQYSTNQQNLVMAEKVFSSRKALYSEGVTTLMELLDAERDLSKSRNLHMQSLINVQAGLLNVYKANGTLLTEFLKTL